MISELKDVAGQKVVPMLGKMRELAGHKEAATFKAELLRVEADLSPFDFDLQNPKKAAPAPVKPEVVVDSEKLSKLIDAAPDPTRGLSSGAGRALRGVMDLIGRMTSSQDMVDVTEPSAPQPEVEVAPPPPAQVQSVYNRAHLENLLKRAIAAQA